jgi:hypothetical protein
MTAVGWFHFAVFLWHQILYLIAWLTIIRWVRDRWRDPAGYRPWQPLVSWWLPARLADPLGRCPHMNQRPIHGDEINAAGGKRARCLDCGRLLPNLPSRQ